MTLIPAPPRRFKYHVLLSYSSQDAGYVNAVSDALLREKVKVFDYAKEKFWGESLKKGIERRYKNEALFCAVFISEKYLDGTSSWTQKEFVIVKRVAKQKPGYMLPVLLGVKVPDEIKDIAWLDVGDEQSRKLSPLELADTIVAKILDPPPKRWWFYVSWQVKLAIAAVVLALILFTPSIINYFLPSRTSLTSADASGEIIIAHVENDGPKSATLVGQRLKFGSLPIQDTELRLGESESATIAPGKRDVKLTTFELLTKCGADKMSPSQYRIEPLLDRQPITLEIAIRESNDAPGHSKPRAATFPADHLKPLVEKWVSTYDTRCN